MFMDTKYGKNTSSSISLWIYNNFNCFGDFSWNWQVYSKLHVSLERSTKLTKKDKEDLFYQTSKYLLNPERLKSEI